MIILVAFIFAYAAFAGSAYLVALWLFPIRHIMVRDEDIYPIDSVVRLKKTGEMAIIKKHGFLKDGKNFLHYEAIIEGRGDKTFAIYHEDVDLEVRMEPRKPLTIVDLKEASEKLWSSDNMELAREQRALVFTAIDDMRKEVNRTLQHIVEVYANPKVIPPFSEQKLKAAGIAIHSAATVNSDLIYKVLQFDKQIGPDVRIKWPLHGNLIR